MGIKRMGGEGLTRQYVGLVWWRHKVDWYRRTYVCKGYQGPYRQLPPM